MAREKADGERLRLSGWCVDGHCEPSERSFGCLLKSCQHSCHKDRTGREGDSGSKKGGSPKHVLGTA